MSVELVKALLTIVRYCEHCQNCDNCLLSEFCGKTFQSL